jgi:Zn-dependent M28 family amino/carboxypeptidase
VRWLLAAACAACGGDGGADVPDAGAEPDAPPGCTRPALDPATLQPFLVSTIAELPAPRAVATQRDAARGFLAAELAALGWTAVTEAYAGGANVTAEIPATTGSAPRIVLGAHFDTVANSPGANDNASGVAVVLSVARLLADVPCRAAPVTIIFFDQEELGLFGARAHAQTLDTAAIRAVHTIDQVAWDDDGDRVFELELPTAALEAEWRAAASVIGGASLVRTSTSGTDHEAYRDRGFAAIGLTEEFVGGDTSPHRHQSTDTPATVDADYLTLAARLTAQVIIDAVAQ